MPARPARRGGIASVLAMLFMVVFAALALGFHAETNTSAQVAANDRRGHEAMVAAESGVAFMRYQLGSVAMPPGLTHDLAWEELHMQLQGMLLGTGNLGTNTVGYVDDLDDSKDLITVPAEAGQYVSTGTGGKFRATISRSGEQLVLRVVVRRRRRPPPARGSRSSSTAWTTPARSSITAWPPSGHRPQRRRRQGRPRRLPRQRPVHRRRHRLSR